MANYKRIVRNALVLCGIFLIFALPVRCDVFDLRDTDKRLAIEREIRNDVSALRTAFGTRKPHSSTEYFTENTDIAQLYIGTLKAIEDGLDFMWRSRREINLDGVIGIRIVEGKRYWLLAHAHCAQILTCVLYQQSFGNISSVNQEYIVLNLSVARVPSRLSVARATSRLSVARVPSRFLFVLLWSLRVCNPQHMYTR